MYNITGRIGAVVPANNSVLEPEFWSLMPPSHALYVTRLLAKGDLTADAVTEMESGLATSVDQLEATGVDVLVYADMVTTFVMNDDWNELKTAEIGARIGAPCISAWTAMQGALTATGIERIALGTPYPRHLHDRAKPFFENQGFEVVNDQTLDIVAMREVPTVTPVRLREFVQSVHSPDADAVVLLATDLPTFGSIEHLEEHFNTTVLSSNQTLLWASLRETGYRDRVTGLGKLGGVKSQ